MRDFFPKDLWFCIFMKLPPLNRVMPAYEDSNSSSSEEKTGLLGLWTKHFILKKISQSNWELQLFLLPVVSARRANVWKRQVTKRILYLNPKNKESNLSGGRRKGKKIEKRKSIFQEQKMQCGYLGKKSSTVAVSPSIRGWDEPICKS